MLPPGLPPAARMTLGVHSALLNRLAPVLAFLSALSHVAALAQALIVGRIEERRAVADCYHVIAYRSNGIQAGGGAADTERVLTQIIPPDLPP